MDLPCGVRSIGDERRHRVGTAVVVRRDRDDRVADEDEELAVRAVQAPRAAGTIPSREGVTAVPVGGAARVDPPRVHGIHDSGREQAPAVEHAAVADEEPEARHLLGAEGEALTAEHAPVRASPPGTAGSARMWSLLISLGEILSGAITFSDLAF